MASPQIKVLKDKFDKKVKIQELHTVYFSYLLKSMRMIVVGSLPSQYIYDVTYNVQTNKMYVDVYNKEANASFTEEEFKLNAER